MKKKTTTIIFPSVEEMNCTKCDAITGHSIKDKEWTCVNCDNPAK